jgi:hypothetical protein
MLIEFYFTPELHLKDGRIIRDLAENQEAAHAAAHLFVRWMEELDILD